MKLFAKSALLAVIFSIGTQQVQGSWLSDFYNSNKNTIKTVTGTLFMFGSVYTAYKGMGQLNVQPTNINAVNTTIKYSPQITAFGIGAALFKSGTTPYVNSLVKASTISKDKD